MPTPTYDVPSQISAGDTLAFLASSADTPPATWTGACTLTGPKTIRATVTTSGDAFLVTFSAAQTANLDRGDYSYIVTATKDGERFTIAQGRLRINANPATVNNDDTLEHCQKMLTAIRCVLEGRATSDHESYSIGGRSIGRISFAELRRAEVAYAARVRALQNNGKRFNAVIAFTSPR